MPKQPSQAARLATDRSSVEQNLGLATLMAWKEDQSPLRARTSLGEKRPHVELKIYWSMKNMLLVMALVDNRAKISILYGNPLRVALSPPQMRTQPHTEMADQLHRSPPSVWRGHVCLDQHQYSKQTKAGLPSTTGKSILYHQSTHQTDGDIWYSSGHWEQSRNIFYGRNSTEVSWRKHWRQFHLPYNLTGTGVIETAWVLRDLNERSRNGQPSALHLLQTSGFLT